MIKGKPPRLDCIYVDQPLYFVTLCTLHRQRILANEQMHAAFRRYCGRAAEIGATVGRYVIMPDHIHLFVTGLPDFDLGLWIRGLKRTIKSRRQTWQPGFFDHVIRNDESYDAKWDYVHDNPVRAGLVAHAEDWPFAGEIVEIDRA